MSSYFEIQADRHADEQGRLAQAEQRIERAWDRDRDDVVALLAMGEPLKVNGKTLLDFTDVTGRIADEHEAEQVACFRLAVTHPDLAGHHMQKLVQDVCGELVDLFADDLKDDLEDAA